MSWKIELELDGSVQTIQEDDFISTPSWRAEPSAITSWEATVPWSPGLEDWTRAEARIYFNNDLLLRGEFNDIESADSSSDSRLVGDDILKDLERGGASVTFRSIEVHEAIREYAATHLDEWTVTVYDPDVDTIDENLLVQDASTTAEFEDVFSALDDTDPFVIENDELRLAQTAFVFEAEEHGQDDIVSDDAYSGGQAENIDDIGSSFSASFDLDYKAPAGSLEVNYRSDAIDGTHPEFEIILAGQTIESVNEDALSEGLSWSSFPPSLDTELEPGTYEVEINTLSGTGNWHVDVVAVVDSRFDYTFDNTVHEPGGYLDGPELHPNSATGEASIFEQEWNVAAAELTTSMDDTGGSQALQVTNDGGETWLPDDGSEQNTEIISTNFDTVGATIQGRATLSRYGQRDTATPRTGFLSQSISSWELRIDTDSLAVIEDREYTGSHLENLQRMHQDGDMVFVPIYNETGKELESFVTGQVEKQNDWIREDHTRRMDVSDYANTLTVYGAEDPDTDERLAATATSQSEVDRVGEEIPAQPIFRDNISSRDQLRNIARTELSKLIAEDRLSGTLEIAPKSIEPGYSYEVPILDNEVLPLWSVEFDDSRGGNGSLEFGQLDDLASAFTSIRSEIRETKG